MGDRVATLTVVLEEDLRAEAAQELAKLISLIRGVESVTLGEPQDIMQHIERERMRRVMWEEIYDVVISGGKKEK
jgi:cell division protein FtsX